MRIAWFSPIVPKPPLRAAVYSRAVIERLPDNWEVDLFVDDEELNAGAVEFCKDLPRVTGVRHYLRASISDSAKAFDFCVHQIEDHSRCAFVATAIALWPGICFFHDQKLNRLGFGAFAHSSTGEDLDREIAEDSGKELKVGRLMARGWSIEAFDSALIHGKRQLANSALIVTQSSRGVEEIRAQGVSVPVELTTLTFPPIGKTQVEVIRESARKVRGFEQTDFVIGYAGEHSIEDRLRQAIEGLTALDSHAAEHPATVRRPRLLWVSTEPERLRQSLDRLDYALKGYPDLRLRADCVLADSFEELRSAIGACDCFLGVKFDTLRGYSLPLGIAAAMGVPALTADFGPSRELPSNVFLKIDVGAGEGAAVGRTLIELEGNRRFYAAVSENSKEFAAAVFSPDDAVRDLVSIAARHYRYLTGELESRRREYSERAEQIVLERAGEVGPRFEDLFDDTGSALSELLFERSRLDFGWSK